MRIIRLSSMLVIAVTAASISCGGGGGGNNGGGNNGGGTPPPPALTITSKSPLPASLQGRPYSITLSASGGQPPLHWSIAKNAGLFVDGLTIDANTGVLSGTPTFLGTGGFVATVTDSASHTATAVFTITDYQQLTSASAQAATVSEFTQPTVRSGISGGLPPVSYTVSSGTMPPGLRFDGTGQVVGAAFALGTYQFTITAQDSYSPPETASQPFTITVLAPPLSIANSPPFHVPFNRLFSTKLIARGGTPPYLFGLDSGMGILPTGLSLDASTGIISGTPTVKGRTDFVITLADSSSPPQNTAFAFSMLVEDIAPLGRNDSPATATLIDNGFFDASISPYIDPPNGPPSAADNDYYKLVSIAGATVHVETFAKRNRPQNPLDTVIEIVDGNGIRLNSCRQPGDTTPTFTGSCINDDISSSPHVQDSALDFLVPGPNNASMSFYIHVFDWRGDARPDMTYSLQVSGLIDPLVIMPPAPATRGRFYSQQLSATHSHGVVSWSLVGGKLPDGLLLTDNGIISGTPTTDGSFSFTLQVSDAGPPAQVATAQETMVVAEPVKINLPGGALQSACVNQAYSYTVPTTGGASPFSWTLSPDNWTNVALDSNTGTFSGTPNTVGTFTAGVFLEDAAFSGDFKEVTLTVQQCP